MAGLTFVTVSANDMAVVNETVESDDQEESLEDVSNDTSGTNIPLKISLVSKLAFPDVMNMPLDDMIPPVGINLEDVPELAFPADAGAMNLPLDDMLPRGFDLKDAQATNLAKMFDFDVASSSSDVESAPVHAGMILHYLSEDEKDLFEVHGASNVINFHPHTKHGEVSLQDSAQSEAFSMII